MSGSNKFRKYLYNFIWVILVVLFIFFATGIYLVNKHQEDIKDLSISRINEVVQTKISVDQIDVTFLRTFPYLSVVFHDVTIWSSHNFDRDEFQNIDTDRLFMSEKVYLKFNAIDLIRKKIRIRRIYAVIALSRAKHFFLEGSRRILLSNMQNNKCCGRKKS